ncbi:CobW family GTP-binding protein [Paenibacillus sambharensis]|uniref:CobW family GTP-binding protein n=1 Tax=Paenibacillus sambharensis TaxID=1803190 RepID=UPI001FECF316|nr:GTP-binding protein [Paenibacillus sambharensis]
MTQYETAAKLIPIHILSGFLGSGKTTLLTRMADYYKEMGCKPAIVMNELGEVNLDGQILGSDVAMTEMLGGCICCTIRGDLTLEIKTLIDEHHPDVILIESTGAANPLEIIDGVTEAAMYTRTELRSIITVVDGPVLIDRQKRSKDRTFKLMREQIRCATRLILNKADKLEPEELVLAEQTIREWNSYAPLTATIRCAADLEQLAAGAPVVNRAAAGHASTASDGGTPHEHSHGCRHTGQEHPHGCDHHNDDEPESRQVSKHESHDHVMAVTYYFNRPVDSKAFELFLQKLPENIYRAKGILTFRDAPSRFLFQYAFRESDFIKINPQGDVHDVAVFIGEHFSRGALLEELAKLEG